MSNKITIFLKELKEILRDKRTLTVMLIIPLVVYPLLFSGISGFMESQVEKAENATLRIGLAETGGEDGFSIFLQNVPNVVLSVLPNDTVSAKQLIEADSLDAAFFFPANFAQAFDSLEETGYTYFYTSTNNEFGVEFIRQVNSSYQDHLTSLKLAELKLNPRILEPATGMERNIASSREQIGSIIGGIIPYFFIIFCLIGCMYPAMDLAAGEKERGTLETLLVSPASRLDIYLGKFMAVALSGFISALAAMAGILISSKFISGDAGGMAEMMSSIIAPETSLLLLAILLPLNAFFAAITLMLSIYARTFKEAQSLITPLMIFAVFPAVFGMLPGVTLNYVTAWVPIMNVSLGAKEIIAGTVSVGPLVVTYISLLVYAILALMISVRFFNNEKNIMRG
jgi:sodium transport system permease protein